MNPFWKRIITSTILGDVKSRQQTSDYRLAKGYREFFILLKRYLKDAVLISLGILSASFGFKGFLLTNHFIDGGATGISLLISELTHIPLYILVICINIPFVLLDYRLVWPLSIFRISRMITYW